MKQLICGSLNGMRVRQTSPHPYIPWSEMLSWKGQWLGAGVKGLWSNPRVKAAVQCAATQTLFAAGIMALSKSFFEALIAGDQKVSFASLSP